MTVRVRAWEEQLRPAIVAAFCSPEHWTVAQGRQGWRNAADGELWSRCVVLFDDDEPVAVASVFHSRLHAQAEWAALEVLPRRRQQGWGRRGLAEILKMLPPGAGPLRAKVAVGSPAAAMAETVGMWPIQRTRQIRVDVPDDLLGAQTIEYLPEDRTAIEAWRDWYVAGHAWDPPRPQPLTFWADMAADTRLVLGVIDQRGFAGIGHLYVQDGQSWFVGGALDRAAPESAGVAAGLLRSAARVVGGRLHVELDDWMTDVVSVIETLQHEVLDEALIVARHARPPDHQP